MNHSKQEVMGKGTIIVLVVGLALVLVHPTEAQQPAKVPAIGFLSTGSPWPNFEAFLVRSTRSRAHLRKRTSLLNRDLPKKSSTGYLTSRQSWSVSMLTSSLLATPRSPVAPRR